MAFGRFPGGVSPVVHTQQRSRSQSEETATLTSSLLRNEVSHLWAR